MRRLALTLGLLGALLALTTFGPVDDALTVAASGLDPDTALRAVGLLSSAGLADAGSPARRFGPAAGLALSLAAILGGLAASAGARRREAARLAAEAPSIEAPFEASGAARIEAAIELSDEAGGGAEPELAEPVARDPVEYSPSVLAREATALGLGSGGAPPAPTASRAKATSLPDRYVLEAELGSGAMGRVFRARDQLLGRPVAVKLLGALGEVPAQELFLREARAMAAVSHPNVVTLFDAGFAGDAPYLVMELVEGRPLRAVAGSAPVAERTALGWGADLADALGAVHAQGLVHRDVKPENALLVARTGRVKLMDFGVAHTLRAEGRTGASGTPDYMAPEQIQGLGLGPWTDVYALGATLHRLLTGQVVFPAGEPFYHALHSPPPDARERLPALRAETAALLLACLAKDPKARPATARLQEELRRLAT